MKKKDYSYRDENNLIISVNKTFFGFCDNGIY